MVRDETPLQWKLVEAIKIAAACPTRLAALYASVARAGFPRDAAAARVQMAAIAGRAGIPID